jgi:hypothetical protein
MFDKPASRNFAHILAPVHTIHRLVASNLSREEKTD